MQALELPCVKPEQKGTLLSEFAVTCILQLAQTGDIFLQHLELRAKRTAGAFQDRLMDIPLAMPQMCAALHLLDAGEPKLPHDSLAGICRGLAELTMWLAMPCTSNICSDLQSLL